MSPQEILHLTSDVPRWQDSMHNTPHLQAVQDELDALRSTLARERSRSRFLDHLRAASKVVSKWPSWKRGVVETPKTPIGELASAEIDRLLSEDSRLVDDHKGWTLRDAFVAGAEFAVNVHSCPECKGTGSRDSGGIHPWGEAIMLPCDHAILREGK